MKDSRGVSRPESEIAAVIAVAMLTLVMSFRTMAQDPSSDIAISMTGSPSAVVPGSNVTYTIAITGPTTATGVTVTDVLPAGIIFVSAKVGSVSCPLPNEPATKGLPGATVTCSVGALTSGRATVTIVVKPPQTPGTMTNIAGVI